MHEELRRNIREFIRDNPPPVGMEGLVAYTVDLKSRFYSEATSYRDILSTIINTARISLTESVGGGVHTCSFCRECELQKRVASQCKSYEREQKIRLLGD